jgi:hypothetical protein
VLAAYLSQSAGPLGALQCTPPSRLGPQTPVKAEATAGTSLCHCSIGLEVLAQALQLLSAYPPPPPPGVGWGLKGVGAAAAVSVNPQRGAPTHVHVQHDVNPAPQLCHPKAPTSHDTPQTNPQTDTTSHASTWCPCQIGCMWVLP